MTDPGRDLSGQFTSSRLVNHGLTADLLTAYGPDGQPVVIVALTPEAGADQAWRASFADLVARDLGGGKGQYDVAIYASDLHGTRPWAASAYEPGRRGVERLLLSMPGSLSPGTDPTALVGAGPQYSDQLSGPASPGTPDMPQYSLEPMPGEQPHSDPFGNFQPGQLNYSPPFGGPTIEPPASPPPVDTSPQVSGVPYAASGPPQVSGVPFASGPPAAAATPSNGTGQSGPAWLAIGLIATVTALIMVATGFAVYIFRDSEDEPKTNNPPAAQASPTVRQEGTSAPLPTASGDPTSPTASKSPLPDTKPTLRANASPVALLGPTWEANAATYTMQFKGWPFAWRAPGSFSCLGATADAIPDANAWACVDTENTGAKQRINLLIRRCPTSCTKSEQEKYDKQWFDAGTKPKRFDARTRYVETQKNDKGYYTVDFSHYFSEKEGGPLVWEVGVFVQSPPATRAIVQKSMNDVLTQTSYHP